MSEYAIPLAALIISITTLLLNVQGQKRMANVEVTRALTDYNKERLDGLVREHQLDRERIFDLDKRLSECIRTRDVLTDENLRLMKRLLNVPTADDK